MWCFKYGVCKLHAMVIGKTCFKISTSLEHCCTLFLLDPQWHEPLLEEHTDEVCMSILLEIMKEDAPLHSLTTPYPRVELVPPCLTILRLLAEYSAACRHRLARKGSTYTLVTR